MNIKVRLANNNDREEVLALFKYQYCGDDLYYDVAVRFFKGDKNLEVFYAYNEDDGEFMGTAIYEYSQYKGTNKIECHGMIHVTKQKYRRLGVFNSIRNYFYSYIREKRNVYYYYIKYMKDAPHINLDREIAAGFIVSDAGNNENLLELFFGGGIKC